MRPRMLIVVIAAVAGLGVAVAATTASAQDTAAVIKQRAALMKKQGADMGAVHAYIDGKADLAKATAAAADLGQTMAKIPDVFPAGSGGISPDGKYATKPEIWTDGTAFLAARDAAAKRVADLSDALKGGGKDTIQAAFADLGKNGCGGCHGKFREEIKK